MLVSIIVPVYNVEKEIERCINSILNQTYMNYEVLLIDDGSTDRSYEICNKYEMIDSRIKVKHKENGGLASARNLGIKISSGDYYVFVDSDDYIESNYLESIMKIIHSKKPDIITVEMIFEKKNKIVEKKLSGIKPYIKYNNKEYLVTVMKNATYNAEACANVYRADFWKKNCFMFEDIYHEDLELSLRSFLAANNVVYCPDAKYHVVTRTGSIMNDDAKSEKRFRDFRYIAKKWIEIADKEVNPSLSRAIKGTTCRTYVYSCALNCVKTPPFDLVSRKDILKYSLNIGDFMKGVFFIMSPKLYCSFWHVNH